MSNTLKELFEAGIPRTFSAGEVILHGEEDSGVFYIASGFVSVYSISDEGNRYLHVIYKSGEIFPMIWALKGIRRRVFYEAASKAMILEVPQKTFLEAVRKRVDISYQVLDQLAEQFYVYADRLDNLQYKAANERIIFRLLYLAGRFGVRKGDEIVIKAPITHEVVAESINLARETVSREIEKLEKDDLIARENSYLVIKDVNKLAAQFSEPVTLDLWGLSSAV